MEQFVILVSVFGLLAVRPGWAVRLTGGPRTSAGRLEVSYNGQWGTVCGDYFDVNDATVVCRILGYTESVPQVKYSAAYGQGLGPIWLDDVGCTGSETDIFQCPHYQSVGSSNCGHAQDVGIDCQPPFQIRLVNGGRSSAGRVEVNINGRWGTVCDDNFDTNDARVVCRLLGYTTETPAFMSSAYYGWGSDPIWLDDLACTGTETSILQCLPPDRIGQHNCGHHEDVGVDCRPSFSSSQIRLVNGSRGSAGRVEVNPSGQWGTVCDDAFGVEDARVACRMLGYTSEQNVIDRGLAYYGQGAATATIWLDDLGCQGSESSLFSCTHRGLGVHNCGHDEDVGVDCLPPRGPTSVSITGPPFVIGDPQPVSLTCTAANFVTSVSFSWSGVSCQTKITSAEFSTCIFTPTPTPNDVIIRCTANNTANVDLYASSSYTLSLRHPPSSTPVITGVTNTQPIVVGSNVNMTCTITGGKPLVTSVDITCTTSQGRTLTFSSSQIAGSTSVSRITMLAGLQLADNGTVCQCSGTWSTQRDLYTLRSSVTLLAIGPPTTSPVITNLNAMESLVVGSSVTFTCTIAGGSPLVTSVDISCTSPGQTLTFNSTQTFGSTSVSRTMAITGLQLADNGTVCQCNGHWSTQPDLYTLRASVTLSVFDDAKPSVSELTLNGAEHSLTVTAGDNTSVEIRCSARGRPIPSLYIERADNRQRPVLDPPSVVNRDESVAQTFLTTSAVCEDAATYYCKTSSRTGADENSIVLFVNCSPRFADGKNLGGADQPVIITQNNSDTRSATIHLTVHPNPTLKRVVFHGQTVQELNGVNDAQEMGTDLFRLLCETSSTVIYRQVCTITVDNKGLQVGYYTLTIGNVFGDMSFMSKLATIEQGGNNNQTMWIAIGSAVGGFVLLAVIVVVVIAVVRKRKGDNPVHDTPTPEQQTTQDQSGYTPLYFPATSPTGQKRADEAKSENREPQQQTKDLVRYTEFPMSDLPRAAQQDENVYDNSALEGDDPSTEYMNVGGVAGAIGGAGIQDKDPVYQNM